MEIITVVKLTRTEVEAALMHKIRTISTTMNFSGLKPFVSNITDKSNMIVGVSLDNDVFRNAVIDTAKQQVNKDFVGSSTCEFVFAEGNIKEAIVSFRAK